MTKPELLRLMRLLSAIESWAMSQQKSLPDYLHDDLSAVQELVERLILKPE